MYTYIVLEDDEEHILFDVDASVGFGPHDKPIGAELPPYPLSSKALSTQILSKGWAWTIRQRNQKRPI